LDARHGVIGGIAAGLIGIGCCAGPTVAALLGIISASTAISLADNLYGHWEWAFLVAGTLTVAAVVVMARRRARACPARPGQQRRFALLVAVTAVVTYGVLYAVTTALGHAAS
jgi:membrane protein implicated in regulation of membrane protease activity